MPEINAFQRILLNTYDDGEYAYCATAEDARNTGDTLFTFLFNELAYSEGCVTQDEALRRIDAAIAQLHDVRTKLAKG